MACSSLLPNNGWNDIWISLDRYEIKWSYDPGSYKHNSGNCVWPCNAGVTLHPTNWAMKPEPAKPEKFSASTGLLKLHR